MIKIIEIVNEFFNLILSKKDKHALIKKYQIASLIVYLIESFNSKSD